MSEATTTSQKHFDAQVFTTVHQKIETVNKFLVLFDFGLSLGN